MEKPGPKPPLPPEEIVKRARKALRRDKMFTWEHVVDLANVGAVQVFWNDYGLWVTEIINSPLSKFLNVWLVAGELPEVMEVQTQVLEHARANDCAYVSANARFGWKKVAREHGWKEHAMIITHEVPHE